MTIRRDRLSIGVLYAVAWGALLVNRGLYWDDWTLWGVDPAAVISGYTEIGLPWGGYVYAAIFATPLPGLVSHVLVFGAYLLATLLLHAILGRIPGLTRMDALVAALTFAVLPVNFARIAVIDLMYGFSLLAFIAATWFLVRYLEDGGLVRRLAALALFLASFYTASLLVLYVVPIVVGALVVRRSGRMSVGALVGRHLDFIALPVAYWLVKGAFLAPSGVYEGYNQLTAAGIARVPGALPAIPWQVIAEPLVRALSVAGVVGVAAGIVVAVWLVRRRGLPEPAGGDAPGVRVAPAIALALAGVVVLGLGVFSYLAVGRVPTIWDWSSRHQLLVPIGVGLLAAALARGVPWVGAIGRASGVAVVGLLLGISTVADARTLVTYQADWFKQVAIVEAARELPALRTARHIRVVDDATALNTLRRSYRFYELNALLEMALGDTRRLASLEASDPTGDDLALFIARPAYHMGEYVPSPVDLELRLSASGGVPDPWQVLRLVALEAIGSPDFGSEARRLIEVEATPVGGP